MCGSVCLNFRQVSRENCVLKKNIFIKIKKSIIRNLYNFLYFLLSWTALLCLNNALLGDKNKIVITTNKIIKYRMTRCDVFVALSFFYRNN